MNSKQYLEEIKHSIQEVLEQKTERGKQLWHELITTHPADIVTFLKTIELEEAQEVFVRFPVELKFAIFSESPDELRIDVLPVLSEAEQIEVLNALPSDELADLCDRFSDEELRDYLHLLHRGTQEKVLSLMQFDPESAGGIMETDVLTLIEEFTVEKSIKIIQRLSKKAEVYSQIFITNKQHKLTGYINLEDLVLHKGEERITSFVRKAEMVVYPAEDQETIAKRMMHYGLMNVPVVDNENHFLGVISSETLVDVLVEEATEDVQKMAALAPIKQPYFEVPFFRLLFERSYILVALLFAESFSMTIMRLHEATLNDFLLFFIPMLISAGGNSSSQTSAVVIQGMASGELGFFNMLRFLRRELFMATLIGVILGIASFIRVYFSSGLLFESIVISISLTCIVLLSVLLGSVMPFLLRKLRIDPAFSAGPFLATIMDVLGIMIYCFIVKLLLF